MRWRSRSISCTGLALLAGLGMAACKQAPSGHQRVGRFEGVVDAQSGTLTIQTIPEGSGSNGLASAMGPIETDPGGNGVGIGPEDTVEMATEWAAYTDLAGNTTSTPPGHTCGRPGTFCGGVTLRSFYLGQELHRVYAVLTEVTPAANAGFASTHSPGEGVPDVGMGLWGYPTLLDATRGAVTGSAPGANAATRTWFFNNLAYTSFRFRGDVYADPVPSTATDLAGTCGSDAIALDTIANCGECGRTAPEGSICAYAGNGGATQAAARLVFSVTCENEAETACDSGNAMAYACVDLETDPSNCGVCGQACGTDETCVAGVCTVGQDCGADGATACGTHCCPAGSICNTGLCILNDAREIGVGGDFACATTNTARLATAVGFIVQPTTQNNVLCWGHSHMTRAGDPVWPLGVALPEYPGMAVEPDVYALSCGGIEAVGLSPLAGEPPHTAGAYFWGDPFTHWEYVAGPVQTIAFATTEGSAHGCALRELGGWGFNSVLCWGNNAYGQLATGDASPDKGYPNWEVPALVNPDPNQNYLTASAISAGGNTTCAILQQAGPTDSGQGTGQVAGSVACWGNNRDGQVTGVAGDAQYNVPQVVSIADVANVERISVGLSHTVALVGGNFVFWGDDSSGQFGLAKTGPFTTVPVPVGPVMDLSAGTDNTCYIAGGEVYCAGANGRGQLGQGDAVAHEGFVRVLGVSGATAVRASSTSAPGTGSVCALTAAGFVYCWGDNSQHQLGGGLDPVTTPFSLAAVLVQLEPL